jgi:hypothetical protein
MPPRPPSKANDTAAATPARGNFRQRYADIEKRRVELIDRLRTLGANAQAHPGHKRALTLLNDTFRKSKLAQRLAVLQAAAWLIDILERLTTAI